MLDPYLDNILGRFDNLLGYSNNTKILSTPMYRFSIVFDNMISSLPPPETKVLSTPQSAYL